MKTWLLDLLLRDIGTTVLWIFFISFFSLMGFIFYMDSTIDRTPKPSQFEIACIEAGGLVLTNSKVQGKMTYSTKNCVDAKMFIKVNQ